jgi:hypothetical protein
MSVSSSLHGRDCPRRTFGIGSRRALNRKQARGGNGPGRSGGVKGLPQAARVRPRALDAENDLVTSKKQGNPAPPAVPSIPLVLIADPMRPALQGISASFRFNQ